MFLTRLDNCVGYQTTAEGIRVVAPGRKSITSPGSNGSSVVMKDHLNERLPGSVWEKVMVNGPKLNVVAGQGPWGSYIGGKGWSQRASPAQWYSRQIAFMLRWPAHSMGPSMNRLKAAGGKNTLASDLDHHRATHIVNPVKRLIEALARSDVRTRVLMVLFRRFPRTLRIVSNRQSMAVHCTCFLTTAK
jgi:hypothetical protein